MTTSFLSLSAIWFNGFKILEPKPKEIIEAPVFMVARILKILLDSESDKKAPKKNTNKTRLRL
jgi:hypothetical protein